MNPFSKAFLDEITKLAEPPPPKGVSLKKWDRILQGKEKNSIGDIDDLEADPVPSLMPTLARAHQLTKGSSWMDIGPYTDHPGRPWRPPGKRKHAEIKTRPILQSEPKGDLWVTYHRGDELYDTKDPFKAMSLPKLERDRYLSKLRAKTKQAGLRDAYNVAYLAATHAVHDPGAYAAAKGLASGAIKANPVRAAGGLAEGLARSKKGGKLLKALKKKGKKALEVTREAIYPTPQGKMVFASALAKLGYRLQGHTDVQGIPISIENRKGSVRKGKDRDGKEWRVKMKSPYGYITGTKGADGEEVDAYVGPDKEAPDAYVVHQRDKETGKYDEDKVMLGFRSKKEAKEAFLKHYNSPKFLGPISKVSVDRLRELVKSKRKLTKIASEREKKLVRKAGPGIGGLVGAGIGAALGTRRGKLLKGALTGLGTGATLGWVPSMAHEAKEGIKEYRRGK